MPPAHDTATELIVIAVILGMFSILIAIAIRAAKQRPAKLALLREAPTVSAYSVSSSRILVVLLLGTVFAAGSAPVLMALSPRTPLLFLVSIGLAFAAVLAPLTFARGLTVDRRLVLEGSPFGSNDAASHPLGSTSPTTSASKRSKSTTKSRARPARRGSRPLLLPAGPGFRHAAAHGAPSRLDPRQRAIHAARRRSRDHSRPHSRRVAP